MSDTSRSGRKGKTPAKRVVAARAPIAKPSLASATYVYALVRHDGAPPLAKAPSGLPKCGRPRAIDAGKSLWIVAADAPLVEYAAEVIDPRLQDLAWVSSCAMGHEAVVEHVVALGATIPMKLFTMFSSDERAKEHVAKIRAQVDRVLRRVEGREEWGVRLRLDEARARAMRTKEAKRATTASTSGAAFLLAKKKAHDAERELVVHARDEADALFEELTGRAAASKRRPIGQTEIGGRILLDAAFLVPKKDAKSFRTSVEKTAKKLAPRGYDVQLTGPWPPYHFVGDEP